MFISDEEAERRLNHKSNLSLSLLKTGNHNHFRPVGKHTSNPSNYRTGVPDLTPFMRELIGTTAHFDSAKNTAKAFGCSRGHAAALKFGIKDSNTQEVDQGLHDAIVSNLIRAKKSAADIVLETLGLVASDAGKIEIANLGVKDKMEVAGRAAGIIEKLTPKESSNVDNSTKVLIYAPGRRVEADFETIEIESVSRG